MEDQLTLLDKYFKLYYDNNYQEKIYDYSYGEIVDHFIEFEIYKNHDGRLIGRDAIDKNLKKIILKVKDLKLKIKLIPLILFFGKEYWRCLMKMSYFDDMHSSLLDEFKSLSFKIDYNKINKYSYVYQDNQEMINDIENKNFQRIVSFNMNPNMGNYQYNRFIYLIANKFFFKDYCHALDKKDSFTFLFFLGSLEYGCTDGFDKRLRILSCLNSNKSLLQIKLLEDILQHDDDEEFIYKTIVDFSTKLDLWQQFIIFYLDHPSRYPKIFKPLSKAIIQLDVKNIDLLLYSIKINRILSKESKEALNSCFLNIDEEKIKKYCFETLFQKWLDFIDTSSDYFGSIILTDIIDLVINYIRGFLDEKIIIKEIEEILYNIEEINSKWFIDKSAYLCFFYKQMSKLFVYSFAIEKYKLNDLKEKISILCSENPILKNETNHQGKTTIQLFNEYII